MQILIQIIKKEKRHFSGGNVFLFFLYRFFSCKEETNFHCFL